MRKSTKMNVVSEQAESDTNRAAQAQKIVKGGKFWVRKVEGLYYPCSETKVLISFVFTAKLIGAFVFAYANGLFSHDAAH